VPQRLTLLSTIAALLTTSLLAAPQGPSSRTRHRDSAPHRRHMVPVHPGVRLEVLEWPGRGTPILLLAGHGDSGHVYDDFAPGLAGTHRVLALSRRGAGGSDQPSGPYDLTTLTNDIVQVLNHFDLDRVGVVGHSIAGDEMLRLAVDESARISHLVFLDAAYDRVEARRVEATFPALPRPAKSSERPRCRRAEDVRDDVERSSVRMPMGEILATSEFDSDGCYVRPVTSPAILGALANAVEPPRYSLLHAPSLAVYAVPATVSQLVPRYRSSDQATRAVLEDIFAIWAQSALRQRRRFEREAPGARVVELRGAGHYVHIVRRREVLKLVKAFLASAD
jgi:non-heme chloroperoxidase